MPGPGEGFRREDGVTWRGSGAPIFSATLPPYPLTQPPPPSPTLSPPPSPHLGMRSLQISQLLTQVPPGLRSARQLFRQACLFCLQLVFESLGEGLHAGVTMSGCAGGRPGVQEGGEQKRGQGEGSRGGHCSPEAVRPPPPLTCNAASCSASRALSASDADSASPCAALAMLSSCNPPCAAL